MVCPTDPLEGLDIQDVQLEVDWFSRMNLVLHLTSQRLLTELCHLAVS